MWWARFCVSLGFEIDLQVLEGCSRTFICALNLKAKDIYVKIASGQVWVIGKLAAYLYALCGGDRIHSQCLVCRPRVLLPSFSMLLMRVTVKLDINVSEGDTDGQMVMIEETTKHLPSVTETQHPHRIGFIWMQLGYMKTKSKSHHNTYKAKSIDVLYLNEKLYCLY